MAVRPLDGIRILDLTRLLPGAYATLVLADLGADVVKLEDPNGGDTMRTLPVREGAPGYFDLLNRGKRSVTLNLRSADARPVLDGLAAASDVVVDSFRPAVSKRLGIDAATLRQRHPRLIVVSITGFGPSGPLANAAGHDINFQAMAGLLRPPAPPGPLIADVGSALQAAVAVLAALIQRGRTGRGSTIEISLIGAARAWSLFPTTGDLASPCYGMYETADGRWLALGALEAKFWRVFCEGIDRADLLDAQHAPGERGRQAIEAVASVIRTRTATEWMACFAGADTCLTLVEPPAPGGGIERGPRLGADTEALLAASGIGPERQAALRAAGVI